MFTLEELSVLVAKRFCEEEEIDEINIYYGFLVCKNCEDEC